MKRNNQTLIHILITVYFLALAALLGKIILDLDKQPAAVASSNIPVLATDKIHVITLSLDKRTPPAATGSVDLSGIKFGKTEPFSQ